MDLVTNPFLVTFLIAAWGLAVKYLPALKNVPNRLTPLVTLLAAILAKIATPEPAHAGGFFSSIGHSLGWLLPPIQVFVQRQIYETWIKPTLEHLGFKGSSDDKARASPGLSRFPSRWSTRFGRFARGRVSSIAEATGVGRLTVYNWISGHSAPRLGHMLRIVQTSGGKVDFNAICRHVIDMRNRPTEGND